jgi:hypothetical protein
MNNYEMVEAIKYLLEVRQATLLGSHRTKNAEETEEIEILVEKARKGYEE